MTGLFYILFFWLIGNGISYCLGGYISGNVVGMILLFIALWLRLVDPATIRPAARFLLETMALFFVPFGVGLMVSYQTIMDNFWAIVVSGIVSTIIVLVSVGWTFQSMNRHK